MYFPDDMSKEFWLTGDSWLFFLEALLV